MDSEAVVALVFGVSWIALIILGCVLLVYFWAGQFASSARAALASILAILVTIGPIFMMTGDDEFGSLGTFAVIAAGFLVIGFPIAFVATRKLDRRTRGSMQDVDSVFE